MKSTLNTLFSAALYLMTICCLYAQPCEENASSSYAYYGLDSCEAYVIAGSVRDYSEFVAELNNNASCAEILALSPVYRQMPHVNTHSCTPGVNGERAMCISSLDACNYMADNDKALRFDVLVSPSGSGINRLKELRFFEQAPEIYNWIDGPSGDNNYPLLYGLRILKNGQEVFLSSQNATERLWNLEVFDFSENDIFIVEHNTVFSFEILPYCPVGNGSEVTAWDIDEIYVEVSCQEKDIVPAIICLPDGSKESTICSKDGVPDVFEISVTGIDASEHQFVITNDQGLILSLPGSNLIDFEGYNASASTLWHIAFEGVLSGLELGMNLFNIDGCFELSNPIKIYNNNIQGNRIISSFGTDRIDLCFRDNEAYEIDFGLQRNNNLTSRWVITNEDGVILDVPSGPPFTFTDLGFGNCVLWNISYEEPFYGVYVGQNIYDFDICYGLSNPITIVKSVAGGGTIKVNGSDEIELCVSSTNSGQGFFPVLTGNKGYGSLWILTDKDGVLLGFVPTFPIHSNLLSDDECYLWHLAFSGNLSGLLIGRNITGFGGCYDLSNPIKITKRYIDTPVVDINGSRHLTICGDDTNYQNWFANIGNLNNAYESTWVLLDASDTVIESGDYINFNYGSLPSGSYTLRLLVSDQAFIVSTGSTINALNIDCFSISNEIFIDIVDPEGGYISVNGMTDVSLCLTDPVDCDIDIELTGSGGNNSLFVLTDELGQILTSSLSANVSLCNQSINTFHIYHIDYVGAIQNVLPGLNVFDIESCHDLSNKIVVTRLVANGGNLTSFMGTDYLNFCINSGDQAIVDLILDSEEGEANSFVLTDGSGLILERFSSLPFDMRSYGTGIFKLLNVSYSASIRNLDPGNTIFDIEGDCFDFSNEVTVYIDEVNAGNLDSDQGVDIMLCTSVDSNAEINLYLNGYSGPNGIFVLTDSLDNIIQFFTTTRVEFSDDVNGVCRIRHLAFKGNLMGLLPGNNINNIQGCYDFSNSINIYKQSIEASQISTGLGDSIQLCINNPEDLNIDFIINSNLNSFESALLVTDLSGEIQFISLDNSIDFAPFGESQLLVRHIIYDKDLLGLHVSANVQDLIGCFALSNNIYVELNRKDDPIISVDGQVDIFVCLDSTTLNIVVPNIESPDTAQESKWLLTDSNGVIQSIQDGPEVELGLTAGTCTLYLLCYDGLVNNLNVANSILDLNGCYSLSNAVYLTKSVEKDTEDTESVLHFDFDDCYSDTKDDSNFDYSEFTADVNNSSTCSQYTLLNHNLYRNNPFENAHSCTEGQEGLAMCVSSSEICEFIPNSDLAVRFSILVEPAQIGSSSIDGMSFYEQAPERFDWINGPDGANNYPLYYGLRILKNGEEIYRITDVETSRSWEQQTFDFSDVPEFALSEPSIFEFEFLAYCLVDNGAAVKAWDMDELNIYSSCPAELQSAELTVNGAYEEEVCLLDDDDDVLSFEVTAIEHHFVSFVIFNSMGELVDVFNGSDYDFSSFETGTYVVRAVSYLDEDLGMYLPNALYSGHSCWVYSNDVKILVSDNATCEEDSNGLVSFEEFKAATQTVADLLIYPNPVSDILQIQLDHEFVDNVTIVVKDLSGKTFISTQVLAGNTSLDVSELSSGLYLIVIEGKEINMQRKFVKY